MQIFENAISSTVNEEAKLKEKLIKIEESYKEEEGIAIQKLIEPVSHQVFKKN